MNVPNAVLVLNDGCFYLGNFIGFHGKTIGELCFNTAMTGYQEVITDPSYYGQIITFTFPHIGNVGINSDDHESAKAFLRGLVIANDITHPSNHRSEEHLDAWLKKRNITGICQVNTRHLVKKIRDSKHPIQCIIGPFNANKEKDCIHQLYLKLQQEKGLSGHDYSLDVQKCAGSNRSNMTKKRLVFLDFGLKKSIVFALQSKKYETVILPGNSSLEQIMEHHPVGVILSNGPGDPRAAIQHKEQAIKKLIDLEIPLLGICLGFQLIGLAFGGTIVQLSCGHHGINHPVYDLVSKKTFMTSQNHEFHLLIDSLPSFIKPTYVSLFDKSLEGFYVENKPIIAVQFHPEGNPGPHDCVFIFHDFLKMVERYAEKN